MKPWEGKHETFLEGKHATLKLLSFLPAVFGFAHSTVAFGVWVLGCDNRPFDAIPDRKILSNCRSCLLKCRDHENSARQFTGFWGD